MNTPSNSSFEDDVKQLLTEVPPQVRDVFVSGKIEVVAKTLMQKNHLHLDQGTILEREIIMLILGLKNPEEFSQALAEDARLDRQTISDVMQDINEQIFVPVRNEMRSAAPAAERPENSTKHAAPAPMVSAPNYAPPPAPAPSLHVAALPPKLIPPPRKAIWNSLPEHSGGSQTSTKLLEDHEEPHIEFTKKAPPPPNLPGAFMPKEPESQPIPAPAPPPVPPSVEIKKPIAPQAPAAPYPSDPYREPIE